MKKASQKIKHPGRTDSVATIRLADGDGVPFVMTLVEAERLVRRGARKAPQDYPIGAGLAAFKVLSNAEHKLATKAGHMYEQAILALAEICAPAARIEQRYIVRQFREGMEAAFAAKVAHSSGAAS